MLKNFEKHFVKIDFGSDQKTGLNTLVRGKNS